MRAPESGFALPNSSRNAISPGISVSAMAISRRPQSASEISATLKSVNAGILALLDHNAGGQARKIYTYLYIVNRSDWLPARGLGSDRKAFAFYHRKQRSE